MFPPLSSPIPSAVSSAAMKVLITGLRGTVGRALGEHLRACGDMVVGWDRAQVPIDQYHVMEDFVRREQPDALVHLAIAAQPSGRPDESWLVNYEWASELAWICRVLGVRFLFTSTAMVFSDGARGPFTLESHPDAEAGYGREKRLAEQRVLSQNPQARVVRLGWQIGDAPGSNNMLEHLERAARKDGVVRASRRWLPATSFLQDTAAALRRLVDAAEARGLYMIDANARWSFFEIARALSRRHGDRWCVEPTDDFVYDQRMLDPRCGVPPLEARLPELERAAHPCALTGDRKE
jgi:dTDP-4-dehydrorhamnose reductase